MRLLVTRPQPDADRTAAALRARGHDVAIAPLLRIEALPDLDLGVGSWSALVLTSANALLAVDAHARRDELLGLPVLVAGRRTAAAARAAGFSDVTLAGGTAAELGAQLTKRFMSSGPLLYLAGEDRSHDLTAELAPHGVAVCTVVAYRAVKVAAFPAAIVDDHAAATLDGVLHFSRRTAEAYLDCVRCAGLLAPALRLSHYCMSAQVAAPLTAAGAIGVRVAARPQEAALIDLIGGA
jgi:uroporphyrinogen-III synthase